MAVHTTTNVFPASHNLKIGGTKFLILHYRVLEEKPINTYEKFYSFFSYNRLQITFIAKISKPRGPNCFQGNLLANYKVVAKSSNSYTKKTERKYKYR